MELKLRVTNQFNHSRKLLIVPYGIETSQMHHEELLSQLLIVPYGIETIFRTRKKDSEGLLIVPYGIETSDP